MTNLFTIPPDVSFLDVLAEGLWERAGKDRVRLADMRLFLPTRRACRLLREVFLRQMDGQATLLPRMQPIGEIDEDELLFADPEIEASLPPAIAPLRRRLLLAKLIQKRDAAMPLDQTVHLAEALGKFLDEAYIHGCDFNRLPTLVEQQELAEHWQETVRFLNILTDAWPPILKAEGCIDPADRRNRLMAAQSAAWVAKPPNFPVIAAGSTGSMPCTARFLSTIANLPTGAVILPGLDNAMNEAAWQAVDDTHPQHAMKQLLELMKAERNTVRAWNSAASTPSKRVAVLSEATRPAAVTDEWRSLKPETLPLESLNGLSRATFAHPQEEALAIALMLREALLDPSQKMALVTPDRDLAERVSVLLARWGIEANDSAGSSLAVQPVGSFLTAVLDIASPDADAIAWLSLLKHPYAACGLSLAECRDRARQLEQIYWRQEKRVSNEWLELLRQNCAPLNNAWRISRPFLKWIEDHIAVSEAFAQSNDTTGSARLWAGDTGETATEWLDELRGSIHDFTPIDGETYRTLFTELLRQASYRPAYGTHPRLSILGPLEARLIRPDFVILGGMNEGTWPPEIPVDPWMSRPMKKDFGMAPADYRIGLSAHDFVQLANAPKVILTRSTRSGGTPTVPSRFLLQLETVVRALGYGDEALKPDHPWQEWARLLDEPKEITPCTAPTPRPSAKLRPSSLSVTDIGVWQRNPYAIYAKYILGLRKLDPLEAEIDASDRGNLIHEILEKFITLHPAKCPDNAFEELLSIGRSCFETYKEHPEVQAFWWPRFERIAAWFIETEQRRRTEGTLPLAIEAKGQIKIDGFTLKSRTDRIDRKVDGSLTIIDYKTGYVATKKLVKAGIEPQLPLMGVIAAQGGFEKIPQTTISELAYWKLSGGQSDNSNKVDGYDETEVSALMDEAEAGLKKLIATFSNPETPYEAVPKPGREPRYDDYAHLARLAEWGRSNKD